MRAQSPPPPTHSLTCRSSSRLHPVPFHLANQPHRSVDHLSDLMVGLVREGSSSSSSDTPDCVPVFEAASQRSDCLPQKGTHTLLVPAARSHGADLTGCSILPHTHTQLHSTAHHSVDPPPSVVHLPAASPQTCVCTGRGLWGA